MTHEPTESRPEDAVHDCFSSTWSLGPCGWHCGDCGKWLSTISGRHSIRDPEPFHDPYNLKPVAKLYARKHGTEDWAEIPVTKPPTICYDFTEVEQALIEAFGDWDLFENPYGD